MSRRKRIITTIILTSVLSGFASCLFAASVELWPAERRQNQTQYCYGGDWNTLNIILFSDQGGGAMKNGKYKFDPPKSFTEETVLEITLLESVEFLGAYRMGDKKAGKEYETVVVTKDGRKYTKYRVPLDNSLLNQRIQNEYYEMFFWYKPPVELDDTLRWTLTYGQEVLVDSTLRLRTAGVVEPGRAMPNRFGFYPYGPGGLGSIPEDNYDKLADLFKRLGVTGFETHWGSGLPREDGHPHPMVRANRRHGIKNIANMAYFCRDFGKGYSMASKGKDSKTIGLVEMMDIACEGLESEEAKRAWAKAAPNFDIALYDWEPQGPREWPGYDEPASIAAFAKARGIKEPLTPELVKSKYRKDYVRFRMEQTARPVYSLQKTINAVKPIPLQVEQGDGLSVQIDYDVYGNDFPALRPMTYKSTPLAYARDILEMKRTTKVPMIKFMPDITLGWPAVGPFRESPEELLLDVIVSAAGGCGNIAFWPGPHRCDAIWYGIHEGLTRVAMVEDFYFDGKPVDTISMKGIPYRVEKIDIGNKVIELHGPDFRPVLITFAHQWKEEYLLTLINYHTGQDAFVEIQSHDLRNCFLADPVHKLYTVCDDGGKAVVRVKKETPDLWIATKDKNRIMGYTKIDARTVESQRKAAREKYLKTNKAGNVKLGKVGGIEVAYDEVPFGGGPQITLRVSTPEQTLFFGDSGGRIYDWTVKGMSPFVGKKTYSTDGFGMDLLWLPENSRWKGDETRAMRLVTCDNDGKSARVVYEGEFKNSLPGVTLRKEYMIPAQYAWVVVKLTFWNERSGPVTLSYWQHNVVTPTSMHFISDSEKPVYEKGGTSVFPKEGLSKVFQKDVVSPEEIRGTLRGEYAEYFPETKSGLVFHLPEEFMNVYRWVSPNHGCSGSEWMTIPLTLAAGESKMLHYSIMAVPNTTPDALRKQME
ncbi:MAG: hypothetical protein JXA11_01255 [Phycisphaerae bacterium]|nr:hypothetical protein [Phycisphaerae bacterium]